MGTPVDAVRRRCNVVRETTELSAEGLPEHTIAVDLGRDTVTAVVEDGRIWRLHVRGAAFRTADSLGVGTPVAVLRRGGRAEVLTGEGAVFVTLSDQCGLSFRLAEVEAMSPPPLEALPESAHVEEVLAVGCAAGEAPPT